MHQCTFELNGEPLSQFKIGSLSFPAFSGKDSYVNKRTAACIADLGPIPPGEYYIFDRQSGGRLGRFVDSLGRHQGWFALHAIDGRIDDETFCQGVKRGHFRLHPKGAAGISRGCIAIEHQADFCRIHAMLKSIQPTPVNGSDLLAYGTVRVR
jgi:hypothetical protein